MTLSAVIFDFDGIITNLNAPWSSIRVAIKDRIGMEVESILDFFQDSWATREFDAVSSIVSEFELEAAKTCELFPDVKPTLEYLTGTGTRNYIASMQSIKAIDFFEGKHDLSRYFRKSFGRESAGSKKGELELILALEKSTPREKIAFIDDSKRHMIPCRELGLSCFQFDRRKSILSLEEVVKQLSEKQ